MSGKKNFTMSENSVENEVVRRRPRWLVPLVAGVCVVALAGGVTGGVIAWRDGNARALADAQSRCECSLAKVDEARKAHAKMVESAGGMKAVKAEQVADALASELDTEAPKTLACDATDADGLNATSDRLASQAKWYAEPSKPSSSTSLAYTRLAVWRCLRGMSLSANSHESTVPEYASIRERRPFLTAGFGEQSSMVAYFLTVSLDTPSRLAISRHDTPWASRILIRCCIDTGFVIPFLSRVALSAECVSTRENSRVMAGRCPSSRHFGETD
ncbi:hypothetical protein [Bifidobacterium bifidum]|uniref:hypothetical protein n=1 Tax=Bifidobacterium bifidum TaxID=1681 RepID=UPI003D7F2397